jgi:hypothetical protein
MQQAASRVCPYHPLKVETRVRTPLGLPGQRPCSSDASSCVPQRPEQASSRETPSVGIATAKVLVGSSRTRRSARRAQVNRLTKSSAVWATSCQPLSMVSEWPRLGIILISVTLGFRFCRL